jgi:hypothetical protein
MQHLLRVSKIGIHQQLTRAWEIRDSRVGCVVQVHRFEQFVQPFEKFGIDRPASADTVPCVGSVVERFHSAKGARRRRGTTAENLVGPPTFARSSSAST